MHTLRVTRLTETAKIPTQSSPYAAGWDLYADEDIVIKAMNRAMVATGIAIALPQNTAGLIWPRSGLAYKHGIDVLAGVIDSDYRGGIGVVLQNHSGVPFVIQHGDRIAQLLIQPLVQVDMMVVTDLDHTDRGDGGFGSTGK